MLSQNFNLERIFNTCIASRLSFEYQSLPPSPWSSRDIGKLPCHVAKTGLYWRIVSETKVP